MLLDQRHGLVVHQRVDDVVEGVGDDLAHGRDVPAGAELRHELPHLLHLVVVGAADEVDELGVRRAQHRAPGDQAAGLEGLAEGKRARLGDDRLVEVEEGRGRAPCPHRRWRSGREFVHSDACRTPLSTREIGARRRRAAVAGSIAGMTAPLFVTRDQSLLDELLRLAAAAGITPDVAPDTGAALRRWPAAPLVLVGADLAAELAAISPARRPGVHVVAWGPVPDELFRATRRPRRRERRRAARPRRPGWSSRSPTSATPQRPAGTVIGVIGGSGGAGATTFACALGQLAARRGPRRRDRRRPARPRRRPGARPRGPRRRPLGRAVPDDRPAQRPVAARGAAAARGPRRRSPGTPGAPGTLQAFAVREALSAAQRGHDFVVVDLPRSTDALVDEVAARCDRLLVVVVPTVAGVASAARICARHPDPGRVRLVLRGGGVESPAIARATRVPVLATMPDQRGLAESIDLGPRAGALPARRPRPGGRRRARPARAAAPRPRSMTPLPGDARPARRCATGWPALPAS